MAEDDDVQTKTGGTEMTGATGTTGATGAGAKTPEPATDPPPSDPLNPKECAPPAPQVVNIVVDVEAQQQQLVAAKVQEMEEKIGWENMMARRRFVQKVFGMVGIMLAVVVFMTLLPFVSQNFRIFALKHEWLFYLAYLFYLITYISLVCCECTRKTKPLNYIMTGILVFSMGWMTIAISVHSDCEVVLLALVMTSICCAATIIFAMKTNLDFTNCGIVLFFIGIIMFIFGLIAIIAAVAFKVYWLYTVYAGLMTIVMMAYLAYDVQQMMGGKKVEISVHDPFYAAVQIFVDIALMFMYMIQFLQGVAGRCAFHSKTLLFNCFPETTSDRSELRFPSITHHKM